jgi:hypothetical protein
MPGQKLGLRIRLKKTRSNKKGEQNMRRTIVLFVAVLSIGLACGLSQARAQDESKDESKTETSKQSAKIQPVQPYRLDFSFNEVADGKTVNTRHYSMDLTAGEPNTIKIGTRVPVATGTSSPSSPAAVQYQYLDVGTNIWAQLREHGDELVLAVRSDVSNLDVSSDPSRAGGNPVVRQIRIDGSTLLTTGKPILIGSMDDPNSKRQFQLEVTVTKLR